MIVQRVESLSVARNRITGSLPEHTLRGLALAVSFRVEVNYISSSLPHVLGFMTLLAHLDMSGNRLSGSLPGNVGWLALLRGLHLAKNVLSGSLPGVIASLALLSEVRVTSNELSGAIPDAVRSVQQLRKVELGMNKLSGRLPSAMGSWMKLNSLQIQENSFSGSLLDRPQHFRLLDAGHNRLQGSIPPECRFVSLRIASNELSGHIPVMVETMLEVSDNGLSGSLPDALLLKFGLRQVVVPHNKLKGSLPGALSRNPIATFCVAGNQLSGPLPKSLPLFAFVFIVADNKLTGTLCPGLLPVDFRALQVSGNLLEGLLDGIVPVQLHGAHSLKMLELSNRHREDARLQGSLPAVLCRAVGLQMLLVQNHNMEGNIPKLTSTLQMLALHHNHLKTLPSTLRFDGQASSFMLVHSNLLSCDPPEGHAIRVNLSLAAFGNHLRRPGIESTPSWISPMERDGLFWTSGTEGRELLLKVIGAGAIFARVAVKQLGGGGMEMLHIVMTWQRASGSGGVLALLCACLASCAARRTLVCTLFLMLLMDWDLYRCPRFFALASACLRDSAVFRTLVVLLWGQLCSQSITSFFLSPGAAAQRRSAKGGCQTLLWAIVVLLLSVPAVIDLAGKSVPGLFGGAGWWLKVISAGIGSLQALLSSVIVPALAGRCAFGKHAFISFANLLTSILIPAAVVAYMDKACLGRWTKWWGPCSQKNAGQFRRVLDMEDQEAMPQIQPFKYLLVALDSSDICGGGMRDSISNCASTTLLRLQDMWLSKLVVSGFLIPAGQLERNLLMKESGEVIGQLALLFEAMLLFTGSLPLLMVSLFAATLSRILLAAISWDKRVLQVQCSNDGVASAGMIVTLVTSVSMNVALAAGSGDVLALAMAVAVINFPIRRVLAESLSEPAN